MSRVPSHGKPIPYDPSLHDRGRNPKKLLVPLCPLILLCALPLFAGLTFLGGCGDESPARMQEGLPYVEGAIVPETAEEGSSFDVEVWGDSPRAGWRFERFDVRTAGERVLITPIGSLGPGVPENEGRGFHGIAKVFAPPAGVHTIRIQGADRHLDFPLHVFPRHPMLRLMVHGGPEDVHEELAVGREGWAMAFRRGTAPPVRVQLSPEEIEHIRQAFLEHHFFELEDRYISEEGGNDLLFDLSYRDGEHDKRVIAEERAAPESLRQLVAALRELLVRVLQLGPPPHAMFGFLEVNPIKAEPGTARTITLSIKNPALEPVTLHFPTEQIFDIVIVRPMGMGDGDHGNPGGGGGGGMGNGHHGGGGGPGGGGHGNGSHDDPPGRDGHPDRLDDVIWNWAFGREFAPSPTELLLNPGETRLFEVAWPGTSNDGQVVGPGRYHVVGIIMSEPRIPVHHATLGVGQTEPPGSSLILKASVEPPDGVAGAERELRLVVINPKEEPVKLEFPTTQQYDFHIFDPELMRPGPIWSWSHGKGFAQVLTELTIPAQGQVEFVERWNGRSDGGFLVDRPGVYFLRAVLTAPGARHSESVRFRVTQ